MTALRLAIIGTADLSFDEAHYWLWSDRLAPAYFSKGPGVAFTIWSSVKLFGATEFGVRFWSPVLAAGTSLLTYYFTRRLFSDVTAFWLVLAMNVVPIFNIGSFFMTPDALSIFFWMAAMFTFWLALERSPQFTWWWPLTGLLIGLGFLGKYTNALQLVSIVVVLALVPRFRREFWRPGFYSLGAAFAVCTLPPLMWNSQRAWATVSHLRTRGELNHAFGIHLGELFAFLAMHFAVFSPLLFLAVAWAVIASWKRARQQFKGVFLIWFGIPVFALYFVLSINHAANPNWDALAFFSLAILAASFWRERIESRPHLRKWTAAAMLIGLLLSVVALDTDLLHIFGAHFSRTSDRMRGWRSATEAVEQVRGEAEAEIGQPVFMIADERARASELSFYLKDKRLEGPGHPPVYIVESQDIVNQFSFWPRYDEFVETPAKRDGQSGDVYTEEGGVNPFEGRSALYVQASDREPPRNITKAFGSVERYRSVEVRRYGRVIRTLYLFVCKNYRPLPL